MLRRIKGALVVVLAVDEILYFMSNLCQTFLNNLYKNMKEFLLAQLKIKNVN